MLQFPLPPGQIPSIEAQHVLPPFHHVTSIYPQTQTNLALREYLRPPQEVFQQFICAWVEVCKGGHHHLQNSPIFPFLLFIIIIIISLSGSLQGWADVHGINPSADFSSDPGNEFQLCALCSQDLIQHLPLDQPTSNLVTNMSSWTHLTIPF